MEKDSREHTHSSERGIEAERTRGVMKKKRDNTEDETEVRQVYVCIYLAGSVELSPMFSLYTHTHTAINRHLVEHNTLTVFLKSDYQLGGDIKLLYLSVCFYLSIFPLYHMHAHTHTHTHTLAHKHRFTSWISFSPVFRELLELSMMSTGNK